MSARLTAISKSREEARQRQLKKSGGKKKAYMSGEEVVNGATAEELESMAVYDESLNHVNVLFTASDVNDVLEKMNECLMDDDIMPITDRETWTMTYQIKDTIGESEIPVSAEIQDAGEGLAVVFTTTGNQLGKLALRGHL